MPYKIRKLRNKDLYQVKNVDTDEIHSKHTTLANAKRQVELLERIEYTKKKLAIDPSLVIRHF